VFLQVQKLRLAMQDYDNDRWRAVSGRVGGGLSAAACREKATELEENDRLRTEQGGGRDEGGDITDEEEDAAGSDDDDNDDDE